MFLQIGVQSIHPNYSTIYKEIWGTQCIDQTVNHQMIKSHYDQATNEEVDLTQILYGRVTHRL